VSSPDGGAIPNGWDLNQLNQALWQGDAGTAVEAAEALTKKQQQVVTGGTVDGWRVTIYDKMWKQIGIVGKFIECSGIDPRNNLANCTLKVMGDDPSIPVLLNCQNTMVGVTVETEGLRFAFYVDTFELEFKQGEWIGTANLLGIWDILNYLLVWPDWFMPIQAQFPLSYAICLGPLCSVIEALILEQALRIQLGLNEFINNALSLDPDIAAWFGSLLISGGNLYDMLNCPIVVALTNPLTDASLLVMRTVRMETCGSVIKDMVRATGIDVRVDLWLPGDPQPANVWTTLIQPTYVITVVDRSQITGPTHTVLDSIIKTVVDVAGSILGNEVAPLIEGFQEVKGLPQGFYIAPALGVNWVPPWVLLIAPEPGQRGSVDTCKIVAHTPKGWQHIIGGRSPQWLNDLINIFFEWIVDAISILIGISGVPNDLLAGFLNNAFLAFQLWESFSRRSAVGPYHPAIEVFHATASAPYNIETIFDFINAFWDARGWVCVQATIRNGVNYTLGKDIFRGQLISIAYLGRTQLYTDFLDAVSWKIDADTRDLMLQIGDGKAIESPLAKHQRNISGALEALNVLTLAPQSG
jgi:hypothetical protein